MNNKTFHMIGNAHLDPVWLWDWREGLNEGIATSRAILDLMDENPDLTCIRGEAAIYRHIEQYDPRTFVRIKQYVQKGRWDVVGGVWVQPDMNLPGTETLARHFLAAKRYFRERFGRDVTAAWAADAFGHSAGLPELLAAAGMKYFAFTRPRRRQLPLEEPAFHWVGAGGARILAYRPLVGQYLCERANIAARLDKYLAAALASRIDNVGIFYGLGNHGGGPTRRILADIRRWAEAHPEIKVVFSGLHAFFAALAAEAARRGAGWLPEHRGELNFCMRGCYVSAARFKAAYRRAEALVHRTERTDTLIRARFGGRPADLSKAWEALLFNSFHDILPGTSIERAYDDQLAWLGQAVHSCRGAELAALNLLAGQVDTSVPQPPADHPAATPFLVWNPHPCLYQGPLELEACLDHRPIAAYAGRPEALPLEVRGPNRRPMPFQTIATEHASFPNLAWRKRIVINVKIPPWGWSVFTMGWLEGARRPRVHNPVKGGGHGIRNEQLRIRARKGARGVDVFLRGRPLFGQGGLQLAAVDDEWGSWGDESETPASAKREEIKRYWKITGVHLLESGPERCALWVRFSHGRSRADLTFTLARGRAAADVQARIFWDERSARLKLIMPCGGTAAAYDVPGGVIRRGSCGEVPGGRWVRVETPGAGFGFASDALYGFNLCRGVLEASIVRSSRYADTRTMPASAEPWRPAMDLGELQFRFLLAGGDAPLAREAEFLEQPLPVLPMPAAPGGLGRAGSLGRLLPAGLQLLAVKPACDGRGWIIRAREIAGRPARARLVWMGEPLALGRVGPYQLASWRIGGRPGHALARKCKITEN